MKLEILHVEIHVEIDRSLLILLTAHLLPVSPSMHCAGGCLLPGGVCSWVCVSAPLGGGCLPEGLLLEVSAPRGCLLLGVCYPSMH